LALAKTDSLTQAQALHDLIGGALAELKLHASYAEKRQIDLTVVKPYRATSAYTNFLLAVAWRGDLAASVHCTRLYAHIGIALQPSLRPAHPYQDWSQTYSSAEFGRLCIVLYRPLDATASDTPAVRDAYRFAMHCELEFFTAPLGWTAPG